jgi:hypothetical protein
MATALNAFDALHEATKELEDGTEYEISLMQFIDLQKLKPSDLMRRGFSQQIAERVSADLREGNLLEIGSAMGHVFVKQKTARS